MGDQGQPGLAYNRRDEEHLVVWSDGRDAVAGLDIWAQFVGPSGGVLSEPFLLAGAAAHQGFPQVAYGDRDDAYLAVGQDERDVPSAGSDSDIYGRWLAGPDLPLGEFAIASAPEPQVGGLVAYNGRAGEFLVVWTDRRSESETGADIYGQRLKPPSGSGVVEAMIPLRGAAPASLPAAEAPALPETGGVIRAPWLLMGLGVGLILAGWLRLVSQAPGGEKNR